MKERIHEQISHELKMATRLDLKIVVIDIVVSLILFFVAMGFASSTVGSITQSLTGGSRSATFHVAPAIIMFVCVLTILAINWFSIRVLLKNKKQRARLNEGLMKLYKEEMVDQYYDGSIFTSYETRYNLFAVMIGAIGAMSIIAPLVIFIDQLTKL